MLALLFDDDLGLSQRVEELPLEQFIAQLVSVIPSTQATSAPICPCANNTSAWRSFATITSAEYLLRGMVSLLQIGIAKFTLGSV
jgi:hypothetical protein